MASLREMVWAVFCGALICSLILHLGSTGPGQGIRRMLCGVFMTSVVLSGLLKIDLSGTYRRMDGFTRDADAVVGQGLEMAEDMRFSIITERCEAYILDKATALGAEVTVSVTLDPGTGLPCAAQISGNLTPWEKQMLSAQIAQALGIEKEALDWKT